MFKKLFAKSAGSAEQAMEFVKQGFLTFQKGDIVAAIKYFDKAIEIDPYLETAYRNRGIAYSSQGNQSRAIDDATRVIDINPSSIDGYVLRGDSHVKIGNYDQAIADYSKAIELNPNEGNVYYQRAHAHYSKGQLSHAVADFESCLPFAPDLSIQTEVKNYIDYLNNHGAKDGDVDFSPRMPDVDSDMLTKEVLTIAQDLAEIQSKRHLVILTPGRLIKTSGTLPERETLAPDVVSILEAIAPSNKRLNIIAVGMTEFRAFNASPSYSVPFLYLLHGFVQIGHSVILFEGHPSGFAQMCRNRDLLIVDSEMIPFLQQDWVEIAKSTLRNPKIVKVNRKGMKVLGTQML